MELVFGFLSLFFWTKEIDRPGKENQSQKHFHHHAEGDEQSEVADGQYLAGHERCKSDRRGHSGHDDRPDHRLERFPGQFFPADSRFLFAYVVDRIVHMNSIGNPDRYQHDGHHHIHRVQGNPQQRLEPKGEDRAEEHYRQVDDRVPHRSEED